MSDTRVSDTKTSARPRPGQPGGGHPGVAMGPPVEKPKDFGAAFKQLLGRLRPERWLISAVIVLGSASVFLSVLGPKILGNATNIIFEGVVSAQMPAGMTQEQVVEMLRASGDTDRANMVAAMTLTPGQGVDFTALSHVIAWVALVYFGASLLSWAQNYIMAGVTQRTMQRLREDVDVKLGRLPLSYFDRTPRGDLLSRVTNDIDNISSTLQQSLTQTITAILTLIGTLGMMFWISPLLAVISMLVIPASIFVTMIIAKKSKPQFIEQWKWTGSLNSHVEEMFTGHDLVRIYGHTQKAIDDFDASNERMYQASFKAQFISGIIMPSLQVLANLNYVVVAVIGGMRVASGQMSLGDVQAFIQYSRQFTMPITQVASIANLLQSGTASAERVFELLAADEQTPDPVPSAPIVDPTGRIAFDDIAFRYEPETPLIDGLSLDVVPGQTVAIVGPTGAGKTTLVNLLMRFYDVQSGRILIDDVDTMKAAREDVRRTFGMVLQDTWLFEGTIYDNLAYGADSPTREDVERAAKASHAAHFIGTLPDGYETKLTEMGENISAGERQLLTIARAFMADPAVLILDEATSSVDTRTEVLIQRAMAELRKGRTSFVIAHRLSTIRDADVILVMNEGQIIEQGSHADLIAAHGFYYDLYQAQFAESESEVADQ